MWNLLKSLVGIFLLIEEMLHVAYATPSVTVDNTKTP
jgi:hypothetical protein